MGYMTEQDRLEASYQKKCRMIGIGLNDFLAREGLRKVDLCHTLELHHTSVKKLLDGEPVSLDMVKLFKVIQLAGYKIVPVREEKET